MSPVGYLETNVLYCDDNLERLAQFPAECIDLIYLDPPFFSNRQYEVIWGDEAEVRSFEDRWQGGITVYVEWMRERLIELHRILRRTGSLYLHCDPTASHYLKAMADEIFGRENFLNEIVWKRTATKGDARRKFGSVHDVILFYGKTSAAKYNRQFMPYDENYVRTRFKFVDANGRRYAEQTLVSPNPRPNLTYEYTASNGVTYKPHRNGWSISKELMEQFDREDRLHFPMKGERLRRKDYLDKLPGVALADVWTDIYGVGGSAKERLGYPTQKPLALLERIIEASSNPGDVVLDPFCGCGTAVVAAQSLGRQWIGIDVTYLAIAVMQARLRDSFGIEVQIEGSPTEVEGARKLARQLPNGREQFELWALTLVGAMPAGGTQKKGADKGVDGVITFTGAGGKLETCIVSVKSGHVTRTQVAELKGDIGSQGAAMGLFVTLEGPTAPMRLEATEAGYYHSDLSGRDYPAVQIITIRELLEEGRKPNLPLLVLPAYQQAERIRAKAAEQAELFDSN